MSLFVAFKVCVFSANSLPHKEFSKIGNKVFIPTGVKNKGNPMSAAT